MGEIIKFENSLEVYFTRTGIAYHYKSHSGKINYFPAERYVYFSLIVLSAKEKDLERAREIINRYDGIASMREIILVGNANQQIQEIKTNKPIKFIEHRKKQTPIITSVKEALSCISNFSTFAVVCPASKECIEKSELESILKNAKGKEFEFIVPKAGEKRLHPVIIGKNGFAKIKAVRKEQGFKYISKNFFTEVGI